MLNIVHPFASDNPMPPSIAQTAILHVNANSKILSLSSDAEHFLATCADTVQIDAHGVLTISSETMVAKILPDACSDERPKASQVNVYSRQAECWMTFHILPRPGLGATVVAFFIGREPATPALTLTPREMDILFLLAKGLRRDRMAYQLDISVATVDFHSASLRKKLDARTSTEAVAKALGQQIL